MIIKKEEKNEKKKEKATWEREGRKVFAFFIHLCESSKTSRIFLTTSLYTGTHT